MIRIWQTPDGTIHVTTFVAGAPETTWAKLVRAGHVPAGSTVLAEGPREAMGRLLPQTRTRRNAWRWNGSRVTDEPA